ncbi:11274_t:CDS:2, partial [Gigaspora rosea]
MTATISKIFLSCFPKCATKSSSNKKILNKRKSSHNVTLESSSEQPDQVIKSNYKIEQTILPVIPTVVFNDEIESNLLSTNEDRRKSRILLLNANKNSISDDSQSPKCLKCNGDLSSWDYKIWERGGERTVAVKRLHNSANINPEFLNELKLHSHRFRDSYILQYFGISRHSITGDFMLVMEFTNKGNLRNYLQSVPNMSWAQKIDILESLIIGLSQLHNDAILPHKDFHPGNILISNLGFPDDEPIIVTSVSDFGLTKPASIQTESKLYNTKSGEFYQQFKEADENRHKESTLISIHPQAIYTSRPLKQFTRYTTISYVESLESSSFYEHSRHNST